MTTTSDSNGGAGSPADIAQAPASAEALEALANAFVRNGEFGPALAVYASLVGRYPDNERAGATLGQMLYLCGYPHSAEPFLRKALAQDAASGELRQALVSTLAQQEKFKEAIDVLVAGSAGSTDPSALEAQCRQLRENFLAKFAAAQHGEQYRMDFSPRRNWAIICGAVRRPQEFLDTVEHLLRWKNQGLLEGIILATWEGELDGKDEIRSRLAAADIEWVKCPDPGPDRFRRVAGQGNFFRQMVQLHYGLDACPEGVYVFKTRTDNNNINLIDPAIFFRDLTIDPACPKIFEKRIYVEWGQLNNPIVLCDQSYYGLKSDLRKMVNFDCMYETTLAPADDGFEGFGHEERLHLNVFGARFPILLSFYKRLNASQKSRLKRDVAAGRLSQEDYWTVNDEIVRTDLASSFYIDFIATHFYVLSHYFTMGMRPAAVSSHHIDDYLARMADIPIETLFYPRRCRAAGMYSGPPGEEGQIIISSQSLWLDAFLGGHFQRDELYYRLCEAYTRVSAPQYHGDYVDSVRQPNAAADMYAEQYYALLARYRLIEPESLALTRIRDRLVRLAATSS